MIHILGSVALSQRNVVRAELLSIVSAASEDIKKASPSSFRSHFVADISGRRIASKGSLGNPLAVCTWPSSRTERPETLGACFCSKTLDHLDSLATQIIDAGLQRYRAVLRRVNAREPNAQSVRQVGSGQFDTRVRSRQQSEGWQRAAIGPAMSRRSWSRDEVQVTSSPQTGKVRNRIRVSVDRGDQMIHQTRGRRTGKTGRCQESAECRRQSGCWMRRQYRVPSRPESLVSMIAVGTS